MHPRRSHSFAIVPSDTCGEGGCSTPPSSLLIRVFVAQHLVGQLTELMLGRFQRLPPLGRRHVGAACPAGNDLLGRSEEPLGLHFVQRGIEGSGTDPIAVVGQLLRHPRAVYLAPGGMVEDVQPHGPSKEFPHRPTVANIGFRYWRRFLQRGTTGQGVGTG